MCFARDHSRVEVVARAAVPLANLDIGTLYIPLTPTGSTYMPDLFVFDSRFEKYPNLFTSAISSVYFWTSSVFSIRTLPMRKGR